MSSNSNIASNWAGFRRLWIIIAILLLIVLLLLWALGYGPGGAKCVIPVTTVEKVVETEKLVDNPELLTRIGVLEKDNAQIAGLKTNIADLTKSSGLVVGLQAKVKALEAVDLNFDNPKLTSRISLLETENASIADLKKRIIELETLNTKANDDRNSALTKRISELETENGLIAGLKAKVKALEAVDVNFIKPKDNTELLEKISGLEAKNLAIPVLESRIKKLEAQEPKVMTKEIDNPALVKRIDELEAENKVIPELQAKLKDIPVLEKRIKILESQQHKAIILDNSALTKRIGELETQNALMPGLKAKVKALEAIDINFIKADSSKADTTSMTAPDVAKLYFNSGSSHFPQDENQAIPKLIDYLVANPNSNVSLKGFHDVAGNARWNLRLANKRSNRVRHILLNAGIKKSRINVEVPSKTLGTGSPKEARRVEVKILK